MSKHVVDDVVQDLQLVGRGIRKSWAKPAVGWTGVQCSLCWCTTASPCQYPVVSERNTLILHNLQTIFKHQRNSISLLWLQPVHARSPYYVWN